VPTRKASAGWRRGAIYGDNGAITISKNAGGTTFQRGIDNRRPAMLRDGFHINIAGILDA
jgi:hypothetical protein